MKKKANAHKREKKRRLSHLTITSPKIQSITQHHPQPLPLPPPTLVPPSPIPPLISLPSPTSIPSLPLPPPNLVPSPSAYVSPLPLPPTSSAPPPIFPLISLPSPTSVPSLPLPPPNLVPPQPLPPTFSAPLPPIPPLPPSVPPNISPPPSTPPLSLQSISNSSKSPCPHSPPPYPPPPPPLNSSDNKVSTTSMGTTAPIPVNVKLFFQMLPTIDADQLQMSEVSLYSSTPWKEANIISRMILDFFSGTSPTLRARGRRPIITDGTANVGGNSVSFHLCGNRFEGFEQINSVEIDPQICQMLRNNLEVYHCSTDHVYCQDYTELYRNLIQDVVFLDPPWGGRDYLKTTELDLFLSGVNLIDICFDLIKERRVSLLVLKLPVNYVLQQLINRIPSTMILTHKIVRGEHHSYNIVFCWDKHINETSHEESYRQGDRRYGTVSPRAVRYEKTLLPQVDEDRSIRNHDRESFRSPRPRFFTR